MTREELKAHCERQIKECEIWAEHREEKPSGRIYEEHKLILELLEQKPCDDAISRQAVFKVMRKHYHNGYRDIDGDWVKGGYNESLHDDIKDLPPVTSQQKMGRWIRHDTDHSIYYDCSLCGCIAPCIETADKILWKMANYCPDCGNKMEKENEWKAEPIN